MASQVYTWWVTSYALCCYSTFVIIISKITCTPAVSTYAINGIICTLGRRTWHVYNCQQERMMTSPLIAWWHHHYFRHNNDYVIMPPCCQLYQSIVFFAAAMGMIQMLCICWCVSLHSKTIHHCKAIFGGVRWPQWLRWLSDCTITVRPYNKCSCVLNWA